MTKQYEYIQKSFKSLKDITIPPFQRGLVWSENKRKDLITTLHDGFPFGVLLVASKDGQNESNSKYWQLLDGQQRLSTIIEYSNNCIKYWKPLNQGSYNRTKEKFNSILKDNKIKELQDRDFDKIINLSYEDFPIKMENLGIGNLQTSNELSHILKPMKESMDKYIDLEDLEIPIIKYTGDSNNYPRVFENLNKGGTPLNKYEIYNAAWIYAEIKLDNDNEYCNEILMYVVDYYKDIEKYGTFELSKPADEIIEEDTINLAEFGRAVGKFIVNRLYTITSEKNINEIGFGVLGIATNKKNSEIGYLNNKDSLSFIQKNYKSILERIDKISKKLNDTFDPLLKLNLGHSKGGAKKDYSDGLSTIFKTLSYFADLWDLNDRQISEHLKNIPSYYVFDYLENNWGSHGDSRLYDYYPSIKNKDYSKNVSKDKFKASFENWLSENDDDKRGFSRQSKALLNIYANKKYKHTFNSPGEDDEFEHIIPKSRIKKYDKERIVKLNSLGNGMVLPKYLNLDKKDLTLYEYNKEKTNVDLTELERLSDYPKKKTLDNIMQELSKRNFEYINEYLLSRSYEFSNNFINEFFK